MPEANRKVVLASRPKGKPTPEDFRVEEAPLPEPSDGEVLVRNQFVSVDPYQRALLREQGSYWPAVPVGGVVPGGAVGPVVQSRHPDVAEGDIVVTNAGWQAFATVKGGDATPFDPALGPVSTALGVLGMPGMTAYFGLLDLGQPREGECVFVSAAAGAVGSTVCQIAKISGCRVAGSAGAPEKVEWLRGELGADAAFNYKEAADYKAALDDVCPDGVDVYFDNVGGPLTDAVFSRINDGARIVVCGQIDQYNDEDGPKGPRKLFRLILKQARAEGFLVWKYRDRFPEAQRRMAAWLRDGRLTHRETVYDGIEKVPEAFIGLFDGVNTGKQLVRVYQD
jgi:hypothetical protein